MLFIYLFIFWAGGEIWLMLTKTLLVFVLVEKFQFMFWMFIDFFFYLTVLAFVSDCRITSVVSSHCQ